MNSRTDVIATMTIVGWFGRTLIRSPASMAIDRFQDYDLNLLVVLHVLLEERNVSGAAKRLGVAQSAASRSLGRLRQQLGDELLVRTGRRMALTPRAEAMKEPLRKLLLDTGTLLFTAREVDPRALTRTFRIASSDYPMVPFLPRLAAYLEERAPHVLIDARPFRLEFDEALTAGELDLVLTPKRDASAGIIWSPLMRDRFVTVARRGHPRLSDPLCLEDFLAERHVLVVPDGGSKVGAVDQALESDGLSRTVVAHVPSVFAATQLVMSSDVLATLPWGMVSTLPRESLQVFEPPVRLGPIRLHAGWHERLRHDPEHAWLRGVLTEVAQASELASNCAP